MTAAVTAAVAALAWAGIAVATNRMFWAVAIGSGALIGYCTSRVVGRGGIAVQGVTGVFTVISVLLGQALFLAWQVHQHAQARGLKVDWKVWPLFRTPESKLCPVTVCPTMSAFVQTTVDPTVTVVVADPVAVALLVGVVTAGDDVQR